MLAAPARLAASYGTRHLAYMLNLQRPTLIVLLLAIASPVAIVGQIPDVSPLCTDRPPVTGSGPLLTSMTEPPPRTDRARLEDNFIFHIECYFFSFI